MRYDRLHRLILSTAAAFLLFALPGQSHAAAGDENPCPHKTPVDCACIQKIVSKESWKAEAADIRECINRGWPAPNGGSTPAAGGTPGGGTTGSTASTTSWVPDGGKGAGLTAGGGGGFSYGAVRAPESPPGSRNENASVSSAVIMSSCNFPPRTLDITLSPPGIHFPKGSCLNFQLNLFKDKNGCDSSGHGDGCTNTGSPPGIAPGDTCPADSNNANVYGVKHTATGSVPVPCGGTVPVAIADLTLNKNPDRLLTTTNGSYYFWTYHKSGNGFTAAQTAVALPSYLCGQSDHGHPVKTVDLMPPAEQMITYHSTDRQIAIRLQPRGMIPATYLPPYPSTYPLPYPDPPQPPATYTAPDDEAERFIVLDLDPVTGDPKFPPDNEGCLPESVFTTPPASVPQDYLIRSATIGGSACSAYVPTMVDYPTCPGKDSPETNCNFGDERKAKWYAICNPSAPPPKWSDPPNQGTVLWPLANGLCPGAPASCTCPAGSTSCPDSGATTDANCDTVTMPIPSTGTASCPNAGNMVQYAALNRPGLFYPPSSTNNAVFLPIATRSQVMAVTVEDERFYMQNNTSVTIQASAPPTVFTEGGSITQQDGSMIIMNAPATLNPANSTITFTNGGQLLSAGGTLMNSYPANFTGPVQAGSPAIYNVHVGRSMNVPMYLTNGTLANYLIPTVPAIPPAPAPNSQPPYVQYPACTTGTAWPCSTAQ